MSVNKWSVSRVDAQAGVLVLNKPGIFDVTLVVSQISPNTTDRIEIATFELRKSGSPVVIDNIGLNELPCGFLWPGIEAHPFEKVNIKCDSTLKVTKFTRTKNQDYLVRARGGKRHEESLTKLQGNRGGYQFAASDLNDSAWFGKAGIHKLTNLFAINVVFNKEKEVYCIPLQFSKNSIDQWVYDKHQFVIGLTVKIDKSSWSLNDLTINCDEYEFVRDLDKDAATLNRALTEEYGDPSKLPPLHARNWRSFLDGNTDISRRFVQTVADAVAFINNKIPSAARYDVTANEVICTILAEGEALQKALRRGAAVASLRFSGYEDLGIDSFVTRYKANKHLEQEFTSDPLRHFIDTNTNIRWITNEASDHFQTFKSLKLEDAVHAVAMLYAAAKTAWANDLADPDVMGSWTCHVDALPRHIQYFWSTIYYNTRFPRSTLRHRGIEYHDPIWPHEDDHEKYRLREKYNGNWRTATFRYLDARP